MTTVSVTAMSTQRTGVRNYLRLGFTSSTVKAHRLGDGSYKLQVTSSANNAPVKRTAAPVLTSGPESSGFVLVSSVVTATADSAEFTPVAILGWFGIAQLASNSDATRSLFMLDLGARRGPALLTE